MGSSEDDEALKILASIRINRSINDFQLEYFAQERGNGYSERVIRDVLNVVFELGRRAVPDDVKSKLIMHCLIPSSEMPIQLLLNILDNLGPTQARSHGLKDVPCKKVSLALQVELLTHVVKNFELFSPTVQKYRLIVLPILTKLMSLEYLRTCVSSIVRLTIFQNQQVYASCRNKSGASQRRSSSSWEFNWIKGLQAKFPRDPNLEILVDTIDMGSGNEQTSINQNNSILETELSIVFSPRLSGDNTKRRKIRHNTSFCSMDQIVKEEAVSSSTPDSRQSTLMKRIFAIHLCTEKMTLNELDEYFRFASFQNRDFCDQWVIEVLWDFRRFNHENFSIQSINKFVLNFGNDVDWSATFSQRVRLVRLINASGYEIRSMIIKDKEELLVHYSQNVSFYSCLIKNYITDLLSLMEITMQSNFELVKEIVTLLFELTQFCSKARPMVARKIISLFRKRRFFNVPSTPNYTLPRPIVYFMLLHGDLNLLDDICLFLAEEKNLHYKDDKPRRVQNCFTMEIVNQLWRGKFLSLDLQRTSPHKALFFNHLLVPKLFNSSSFSVPLGDIGGILLSPVFAFIATTRLRHLEDEHNLDERIEGPLSEENVTLMQTQKRTQWLQLSRDAIKLEVLRFLDKRHFTGICDMMFKSLKSLAGARNKNV